ncbi:MAG: 1-acyl-sn-glycerol-3-phosphate acyltransferase [Clostridia bacterium]|nr:1-acyl-sn-glycerol-3-phosphate acyltransferase [Clostridia bacterium]
MKQKIFYYSDKLNDDFAGTNIKRKELPENYPYFRKNPLRKISAFLLYRVLATPIAFLFQKIVYHEKIIGRKKLKGYKKDGFFLYGNHTRAAGDAFAPSFVSFPKKAHIVVDPDCVSIPGLKAVVEDLGALPLPTSFHGMKNFKNAVEEHARQKHVVVIYPEAHIWPFYTDVRPFKDGSFRYPAECNKPVFTFTVTYKKRKLIPFPKATVYIDGPFFPDKDKSVKENQKLLRNICYETMKERSKTSTYEHIKYVKTQP